VFGKLKLWAYTIAAAVAAVGFAYLRGRKDQSEADYTRELNEYVETRRRMDENTIPHDADAALDWLRKRGESSSGM